jgi:hypothetical protein
VTLETFLRSLETQRKRWNSNRKPNGRETDRNSTECELWTVCYSTVDNLLQYHRQSAGQKSENELRGSSSVLDWKTTATVPADSPLQYRGQSAGQKKKENELRETGSVCCWKLNSGLSGVKGGLSAVQRSKTRLRKVVLDTLNRGWRTVRKMLPDCLRIAILEE